MVEGAVEVPGAGAKASPGGTAGQPVAKPFGASLSNQSSPRNDMPLHCRIAGRHATRHASSASRTPNRAPAPRACVPRLVIMVKEPQAGRVKTRLGRQIGTVAATSFYRHAALAAVRRLSCSSRWQTWLAVAPDTRVTSRFWPGEIPRRAQGQGDLGARMQRILDWPGRGPIIIIGTDIPAIRPCHIAAAFAALGRSDSVLGPTPDGGYWLVGLKRIPAIAKPFAQVRWSSEHALNDTLANLVGASTDFAATLADVDDAAGWREVRGWSGRVVAPIAHRSVASRS